MKQFVMSMFATKEDLYKAKSKYFEEVSVELYSYLKKLEDELIESGHGTNEELINILDKYGELL